MAFKMTPFHLAQPDKVQGGNYRNPATIIDRSAEILGAGIQSGVNNFITTYAEAKKDEVKKEEPKKEEPKKEQEVNLEETFKVKNDAFDTSKIKAKALEPSTLPKIEVIEPDSALGMQVGKGSPNQFFSNPSGASTGLTSMSDADLRAKYDKLSGKGGFFGANIASIYEKEIQRRQSLGDFGMEAAAPAEAGTVAAQAGAAQVAAAGAAPVTGGTNPFEGQTFTITPAQMKANLGVFGEKQSRDRSVKR